MRNSIMVRLLCLLVLLPTVNHAASCKSYIDHIRKQIKKSDENKKLDWLTLSDLNKALGEGKVTTPSSGFTRYEWSCPDSSASLTVQVSVDGKITTLTGRYSDEKGAEEFSNQIVTSVSNMKLDPAEIKRRTDKLAGEFNQYFKSNTTSFEEIKKDALARVKAFYAAVLDCTPGTYQYMVIDLPGNVFYTSVIKGKTNENCVVESTFYAPGYASGTKICHYTPASRLLFSTEQAEHDGAGNFEFNSAYLTPFQQAEINDCKYALSDPKKQK